MTITLTPQEYAILAQKEKSIIIIESKTVDVDADVPYVVTFQASTGTVLS